MLACECKNELFLDKCGSSGAVGQGDLRKMCCQRTSGDVFLRDEIATTFNFGPCEFSNHDTSNTVYVATRSKQMALGRTLNISTDFE
jgi:hypothetical protein